MTHKPWTLDDIRVRCRRPDGEDVGPDDVDCCWLWKYHTMRSSGGKRYPAGSIDGKKGRSVRRKAAELTGILEPGSDLLITVECDQLCCNPSHFDSATRSDVLVRAFERGWRPRASNRQRQVTQEMCAIARLGYGLIGTDEATSIPARRGKLSLDVARKIRYRAIIELRSTKELSREFGVSQSAIDRIIAGVAWPEPARVVGASVFAHSGVAAKMILTEWSGPKRVYDNMDMANLDAYLKEAA
jgi:hypothetical protein